MSTFPPTHARALVLKALSQNALATAFSYTVSFARAAILARILSPDAFGLFGIAMVAFSGLQVLSDFGFRTVLVSRTAIAPDEERRWLGTVWVLECMRGIGLAGILVLTAGYVAAFFGEPRAPGVIYIVALSTAVSGVSNTALTLLERRMQFNAVATVEQAANVFGLIAAVALGLWLRSAEALAWGMFVTAASVSLLSYVVTAQRPSLCFDTAVARECLTVGRSLFALGGLTFLTTQFDNIVIGRLLGTAVLGPYLVAFNLAMLPPTVVSAIGNRVLTPYYAQRVSGGLDAAMINWAHSLRATGWLLLAAAVPMLCSSDFMIRVLYGHKWPAAAPVLGSLAVAGVLRGLARASGPMLLAQGRQGADLKAKIVETIAFVALVLLLVGRLGLGVRGAGWAAIASGALAVALRIAALQRVSDSARRVIHDGASRLALWGGAAYGAARLTELAGGPPGAVVALGAGVVLVGAWLSEPQLRRVADSAKVHIGQLVRTHRSR